MIGLLEDGRKGKPEGDEQNSRCYDRPTEEQAQGHGLVGAVHVIGADAEAGDPDQETQETSRDDQGKCYQPQPSSPPAPVPRTHHALPDQLPWPAKGSKVTRATKTSESPSGMSSEFLSPDWPGTGLTRGPIGGLPHKGRGPH